MLDIYVQSYMIITEVTKQWWTKAQRYRWPDHQSFAHEFGRSESQLQQLRFVELGFGFLHFRSPALYTAGLFC